MASAAYFASFVVLVVSSLAAPTPNVTNADVDAEPGWRKEPKGRGTFGIILSSVLTLGLCVWTAIHPNVRPNDSIWLKLRHKLMFVAIGMLAPEIVLAVAFSQWNEARKFHQDWCKIYSVEPGSEKDTLRMEGAFFITMGGISLMQPHKLPINFESNTLTPEAYLRLSEYKPPGLNLIRRETIAKEANVTTTVVDSSPGLDPEPTPEAPGVESPEQPGGEQNESSPGSLPSRLIPKEFVHFRDVQDKGKAEMLGKTLVCVQALWMLVQCVVRKASGLPVTLLEIHVAMHVVCALGMYFFWFHKPQDVGEPIQLGIDGPDQLALEALCQQRYYQERYLKIMTRIDGDFVFRYYSDIYGKFWTVPTELENVPCQPSDLAKLESIVFLGYGKEPPPESPDSTLINSTLINSTLINSTLIIPFGQQLDLGAVRIGYDIRYSVEDQKSIMQNTVILDTLVDLALLYRVARATAAGKRPLLDPWSTGTYVSSGNALDKFWEVVNISNVFPAVLIILIYGWCHAAAWNTHFPTPMEALLWRVSSVVIAVIPAYGLLLQAMYVSRREYQICRNLFHVLILYLDRIMDRFHFTESLVLAIMITGVLAALFGRLYLYVESFLSLRSLPRGSFDSTPWEDYWPHF